MIRSTLLGVAIASCAALAAEPAVSAAEVAPKASETPAVVEEPKKVFSTSDAAMSDAGTSDAQDRQPVLPVAKGPPKAEDKSIERHRSPLDALTERMIGTASKSIRFDWRKSTVGFGVLGSELLERNNFGSTRLGLMARKPFGNVMVELAATRVFTWETDSSLKLALTPYRQHGRPSRFEFDVNVGLPLAEGVVTSLPGWVPPAEMVFSANAGFRYLFYPGALGGQKFLDTLRGVVSPQLTQFELDKMEATRPGGMLIDPARYGLLAGLSLDVYFQPGAFISPRALIAIPLLSPVNGSGLGLWWELSLGLGWTL